MKQLIIRKTISEETAFTFDRNVNTFFVKNLSENPAYVSFEQGTAEDECIKLPANYAQECVVNELRIPTVSFETKSIYVTGDGEIEVQALSWNYTEEDKKNY